MLAIEHESLPVNVSPELWQLLRGIFPPLPSMRGAIAGAPAITFGPRADSILNAKCVDTEGRVTLLRARLHSSTFQDFAYHTNLVFSWSALEAAVLWNDIQLSVAV